MRRFLPLSLTLGAAGVLLLSTSTLAAPPWHTQNSGTANALKGIKFAADACHAWAVGEPPDAFFGAAANRNAGPAGNVADSRTPIYSTKDAGQHWTRQNSGITNTTLNRVDFVDLKNGWAVGEPNETPTAQSLGGTVLHTTNGGKTWIDQTANLPENNADFEGVSFVGKKRGWVAASNGTGNIYFTNDAGVTWSDQLLPQGHGDIADVYFVDKLNGWAVDDNGNILHTSNGGVGLIGSWEIQTQVTQNNLEAIDFWDVNRGVAVGDGGIWFTRDGGVTWKPSSITNNGDGRYDGITFTDVSFATSKTVGISVETATEEGTFSSVMMSQDGGKTFRGANSHAAATLNSISFARGTDDALASGQQGTVVSNEGDPTGDCR